MNSVVKNNYVRTRFIQNRTKYFQPINALIGLTKKPRFIAVPYSSISHLGEYKAIKAAARRKRIAKRGKFPSINPPHEYSSLLGDPTFYTLKSIPGILQDATDKRLTHISYWIQVCEKIRKIKDVISIRDLLTCVKCIVDADHYDPHLFKELTREFSDEFHLLNLDEIGILLRCYAISNCKPIELLDKTVSTLSTALHDELNRQADDSADNKDIFNSLLSLFVQSDKGSAINAINSSDRQFSMTQALAHISMSLSYFSYMNPDVNTLLALYLIKDFNKFTVPHFVSVLRSLQVSDEFFHSNKDVYYALVSCINSFCQAKLPVLYSEDNLVWGFRHMYKRSIEITEDGKLRQFDYKFFSIVDTNTHLCDLVLILSNIRTKCQFDAPVENVILSNINTLLRSLISEYEYSKSLALEDADDNKKDTGYNVLRKQPMRESLINHSFAYAITSCLSAINSHLIAKTNRRATSLPEANQVSLDNYNMEFTISEKIKYPKQPNWIPMHESIKLNDIYLQTLSLCNEHIPSIVYDSNPADTVKMFENIAFLIKKLKIDESSHSEYNVYLDLISAEIIRKLQSIEPKYLQRLKNAVAAINYNNKYLNFYLSKYSRINVTHSHDNLTYNEVRENYS